MFTYLNAEYIKHSALYVSSWKSNSTMVPNETMRLSIYQLSVIETTVNAVLLCFLTHESSMPTEGIFIYIAYFIHCNYLKKIFVSFVFKGIHLIKLIFKNIE